MIRKSSAAYPLSTSDVFNPGQYPRYTYRPRTKEESAVQKWWMDRGKILIVNGPSKTGKTVLVQNLLSQYDPIWIDGHGLTSVDVLWARIADRLNLYTNIKRDNSNSDELSVNINVQAGIPGTHIATNPTYKDSTSNGYSVAVDRPIELVAREALLATERPLVIDDIHFVPRGAQEDIIKALKPLVFGSKDAPGRRVVFISIGNRVINVLTSLNDMRDRMLPLPVEYWETPDLITIAKDGFAKLNLDDIDGELAGKLAEQSFGSPQLMQQLCRELCVGEPNGILGAQPRKVTLSRPNDWEAFFKAQLLDDIKAWVIKLAKGPETRGSDRKLIPIKSGGEVDAYQMVLLAVASTGPKLDLTKDELRIAIGNVVDQVPPPKTVPTAIIKNMSLIAATKLLEKLPSLKALQDAVEAGMDPYAQADLQPVLEYRDAGATSTFTITDPFFAFYLAWGLEDLLDEVNAPALAAAEESAAQDREAEAEEWGELV